VILYLNYLNPCNPYASGYQMEYERVISEAASHNIAVQMVISGVATSWGSPCKGAPRSGINPSVSNYTSFVSQWVPHFNSLGVKRFSIWNEPNYPAFMCAGTVTEAGDVDTAKCHGGSKKSSAALLRQIYIASYSTIQQLKQAGHISSDTQVFLGETADVDISFMKYLLNGPTKLVADGFSLHPYQYCQNPVTEAFYPKCYSSKMPGISQVYEAQNLLAKLFNDKKFLTPSGGKVPLWLTEFGYWRTGSSALPESVRAKWYPMAMDTVVADGVRGMNLYQLWPSPKKPAGLWDTSLLNMNGDGLPSFYALVNWSKHHGYDVAPL